MASRNPLLSARTFVCGFILFLPAPLADAAEEPTSIEDNSFLIEEAYNQEPGVVQHINAFVWSPQDDTWDYTFTQEWPVLSQRHQFSYTLPVSRVEDLEHHVGLGDVLLNYRFQAVMRDGAAFSPRVSLVLPTGKSEDGLGSDRLGYQVNLPMSFDLTEKFVTHFNLGATYLPDAKDSSGNSANNTGINYGMSVVYLTSPVFNFLVELVGSSDEMTIGERLTEREDSFFISPGFRYAINFDSGLQIVPGFGIPIGVGPSDDDYGVIGYLSLEHPF